MNRKVLEKEGMEVAVQAANISISHGFFGRNYGNSKGLYASLNCSKYVGDSEESVDANLEFIVSCLGNECEKKNKPKLAILEQIHSNICLEVTENNYAEISGTKADALVTKISGVAVGVLTADCAPVLFWDPQKSIIGAAHAGWKGAVKGVLESTVQKMCEIGSDANQILVAVGPCIGVESYEIDEDFMQNFSGSGDCFCLMNHRIHFDLPKYCCKRLEKAGIKGPNIEVLGIDTYAEHEKYFSYRFARQNSDGVCGRQISAICLP